MPRKADVLDKSAKKKADMEKTLHGLYIDQPIDLERLNSFIRWGLILESDRKHLLTNPKHMTYIEFIRASRNGRLFYYPLINTLFYFGDEGFYWHRGVNHCSLDPRTKSSHSTRFCDRNVLVLFANGIR